MKRYYKHNNIKMLSTSFPNSKTILKNGRYNESVLLGISQPVKKSGLLKPCPICSTINFIAFNQPVKDKQGNKVISRVNWVECSECKVSYSL